MIPVAFGQALRRCAVLHTLVFSWSDMVAFKVCKTQTNLIVVFDTVMIVQKLHHLAQYPSLNLHLHFYSVQPSLLQNLSNFFQKQICVVSV